ncbi:MAG: tetratricopeptide repeat protein [Candidatus Xenobiia bacterium LiM19]
MHKGTAILIVMAVFATFLLLISTTEVRCQETPEMKDAMKLFYEKDLDRAKDAFHEVFKKEPANTLALLYLLDCYAQKKDISPLLNEFEEAALAAPDSALAKANLGMGYFTQSLMKRDVFDQSLNEFQEALKLDPNLSVGYVGMGIIYYKKRMIPRARSYFSKALKLNPDDIMSLERLGEIFLLDDKNAASAQNLFSRIVELYPSYPDGYFYMGSASQSLGELDKAIEYFQKALELDPMGMGKGYYAPERIGDIYYGQKNMDKAKEYYEKSLKISPDNSYSKRMLELVKNPDKDGDKKDDKKNKKDKKNKEE